MKVGDKYKVMDSVAMRVENLYWNGDTVEIVNIVGDGVGRGHMGGNFCEEWVRMGFLEPELYGALPGAQVQRMKDGVRETLARFRKPKQADNLNHYTSLVVEPLDLAYLNDLDAAQAKVVKYIMRHKTKDGAEGVRKAIDICEKILQYEYGEEI